LPQVPVGLIRQVCSFVQELRWLDLYRVPGVGETLDWAQSLHALDRDEVDVETTRRTLGALLKSREDIEHVRGEGIDRAILEKAMARREDGPWDGDERA
jgi:hypothetical protein